MTLTDQVTTEQLVEARTAIRAFLQEQDPSLDISVGGAVDSLLVDGNALAAAYLSQQVARVALQANLPAIADGTVTAADEDVDNLVAAYLITRQQDSLASGFITFVVTTEDVYSFAPGFSVVSGAYTFTVQEQFTAYPAGTAGVAETSSTTFIKAVYDPLTGAGYQFSVPFTAANAGAEYNLTAGTQVTPTAEFTGFARSFAASGFSGGALRESNSQLVTRALAGLTAKTVAGLGNINALLPTIYPNMTGSTVGAGHALMTRDRGNVFGISTGGKVDLYVKSGGLARTAYLVDATVTNFTARTLTVTLSREQSAGVYSVVVTPYYTTAPAGVVTGDVAVVSVANNAYTAGSFTPEMPAQIDRAFSGSQTITITFTDSREIAAVPVVSMTSNGQVISNAYQVSVEFMPGVYETAAALETDLLRPAGVDLLVKAAVPCVTTVAATLIKPADYTGPDAAALSAVVATAINALPLRNPALDQFEVAAAIQAATGLSATSISLAGTIYGQDGTITPVLQSSVGLEIPTSLTGKFGPDNVFFVTSADRVTVALA